MRCPSCAAEINSNSQFCLNCGAKLPPPTPKPEVGGAAPYTPASYGQTIPPVEDTPPAYAPVGGAYAPQVNMTQPTPAANTYNATMPGAGFAPPAFAPTGVNEGTVPVYGAPVAGQAPPPENNPYNMGAPAPAEPAPAFSYTAPTFAQTQDSAPAYAATSFTPPQQPPQQPEPSYSAPDFGATIANNSGFTAAGAAAGGFGAAIPPVQEPPKPGPSPSFNAAPVGEDMSPIIRTKNWLGTLLLWMLIPLALGIITGLVSSWLGSDNVASIILSVITAFSSLIFMFIMAFNREVNPSKRNFFRATLWLALICLVLVIIAVVVCTVWLSAYLPNIMEELAAMGMDLSDISQYI